MSAITFCNHGINFALMSNYNYQTQPDFMAQEYFRSLLTCLLKKYFNSKL